MNVSISVHVAVDASDSFVALAIYKVPDVRPILQAYAGKDIPIEYAKKEALEKQRLELEDKKRRIETGRPLTPEKPVRKPGTIFRR